MNNVNMGNMPNVGNMGGNMGNMPNMANMNSMGTMNHMGHMGPMGNMSNMGHPGAPVPMMNNGAVPPQQGVPRDPSLETRRSLNTYIYEYFLHSGMYECARAILANNGDAIRTVENSRRDENGNIIGNGLGDDHMDTDNKDDIDSKQRADLPAPDIPQAYPDSCFLYEWFSVFWEMLNASKGSPGAGKQIAQYVQHSSQQQRIRQTEQQAMLRQMRPAEMQQHPGQQQQFMQMRPGMPNGAMNNAAKAINLHRAAMANNPNPQAMGQLQKGQMPREGAEMEGNRRPASPGPNDNAPSPSKRPRIEAPFPQNAMVNGRTVQGMPAQNQAFASPNTKNNGIAMYAANLQQHHGNQMPNKPMPNTSGPPGQGSPMVPQGATDGQTLTAYYNPPPNDMAPGGIRPATQNGQAGGPGGSSSNHALQDYQMQLMLLEQQNKKRLMMARQEQDTGANGGMRGDGPTGPGGPQGPAGGPNQTFQAGSPPGNRPGASPNPAEQMKRVNAQMNNAANMGSPLPETQQNRGSPNPMNFANGAQINPDAAPHFYNSNRAGMEMGAMSQMNGGVTMRPPSSHPNQAFNGGQMNPQMMARQQGQQMPGAQGGPPVQWQGPNGQMAPQAGPQQGTPVQRAMPPPSAPGGVNNATSRNTTTSPQTNVAAPPTPSQQNKAAPKKKDNKNAKSKAAAQKKTNANLNNAGATPAADNAPDAEPPTPATPITPVTAPAFKQGPGSTAPGGVVPHVQPSAPAPAPAAPVAPPPPEVSDYGMDGGTMNFDVGFASGQGGTGDVLTDFDFDSFLHDDAAGGLESFEFVGGAPFMDGGEIGAD